MKRILLSIGLAFSFLIIYLVITSIIVVFTKFNLSLIYYIQIPVKIPQLVFYYFYPPIAEDYQIGITPRKAALLVLSVVFNVLLYSIPVYFLLGLAAKFRKPKSLPLIQPPPPPSF
jgi:hypothetical protein